MELLTKEEFTRMLMNIGVDKDKLEQTAKNYPYFELPHQLLAHKALEDGDFELWREIKDKNPLFFTLGIFTPIEKIDDVEHKNESFDLIDSFLTKKIEKLTTLDSNESKSGKNLASGYETDIISENFAEILASQGHFDRAIAIYDKLILTIPEKSAYFATCIESLNSCLNKKTNK